MRIWEQRRSSWRDLQETKTTQLPVSDYHVCVYCSYVTWRNYDAISLLMSLLPHLYSCLSTYWPVLCWYVCMCLYVSEQCETILYDLSQHLIGLNYAYSLRLIEFILANSLIGISILWSSCIIAPYLCLPTIAVLTVSIVIFSSTLLCVCIPLNSLGRFLCSPFLNCLTASSLWRICSDWHFTWVLSYTIIWQPCTCISRVCILCVLHLYGCLACGVSVLLFTILS
jgi:hypothetical protein